MLLPKNNLEDATHTESQSSISETTSNGRTLAVDLATQLVHEHNHALNSLKLAEWIDHLPTELSDDLKTVFELCQRHLVTKQLSPQDLLKLDDCPTSPILWAAIASECFKTMEHRSQIPAWFSNPEHRQLLAPAGDTPQCYYDPGNQNLETIWFMLRLYRFIKWSRRDQMSSPALTPYGSSTNRSGKGITNKRGNMLEAMLSHCYND